MRNLLKIIMLTLVISLNACSGGIMDNKQLNIKSIKDVSKEDWIKLSKKKIYFGHQSVGNDIMNGIRDIMSENSDIKLNIVRTNNIEELSSYCFAHSAIGQNFDPESKLNEFVKLMDQGLGNNVNGALLKFCFVDIHSMTDLNKLFNNYKTKMSDLKKKYPETIFIHFTVPLTFHPTGMRAVLKKLKIIVKGIMGDPDTSDNTPKYKFNAMIQKEYSGKEPIFDLALYESASRDGQVLTYRKKGNITSHALRNEYTDDGGHLNEIGRRFIAEQFLLFLIQTVN